MGLFFLFDIHNHYAITNSGPYTRKFTMSLLRSFKLSRNHKTNGSLEKQSRRSAVVSMLWSPLPLSVTLLCGHSQAWFGYACRMRRTGKKKILCRWMWRSNMHGHTHEWFLLKKMHFHHGCCRIAHDENEDVRKRNMEQFDQWFCWFCFFYWMCTCMPCMNGKRKLELLCMVAWETSPI